MNTKILILAIVAGLFFASCKKEEIKMPETMNVTMSTSGSLKVKVADASNNPLSNASIKIISTTNVFYTGVTDNSGYCNVGDLLEGTYSVITETTNNSKTFGEYKDFQIIAGKEKEIILSPLTNIGNVSIKAINYSNVPLQNLSIALIPSESITSLSMPFDELLAAALITGTTNTEGKVTFNDLPAYYYYNTSLIPMCYYSSSNYQLINGQYINIYKNKTTSTTIQVSI